jgi:peroxiredoxin
LDFEKRGAKLAAISVDPPPTAAAWHKRKGFTYPLLSDPNMDLIEKKMHIRNPQQPDLAIHAIYILDEQGKIFYRKIGRRRALSKELLIAIDHHQATHPKAKEAAKP